MLFFRNKIFIFLIPIIIVLLFIFLYLLPSRKDYLITVKNQSDININSVTLYYERNINDNKNPNYFEIFSAKDIDVNDIIKEELKLLDTNNIHVEYMLKINFKVNNNDMIYSLSYNDVPSYLKNVNIFIYNDKNKIKANIKYRDAFSKKNFTKILEKNIATQKLSRYIFFFKIYLILP